MSDVNLITLQHETDKGPGVFVTAGVTRYELDKDGCIEASQAAATKLQFSARWRTPEFWASRKRSVAEHTPKGSASGGRRVRTQAELKALATSDGYPIADTPTDETPIPEASPEEPEELVISGDMTKSQLLELADKHGVKADRNMNKATIIQAFEDAL